jgi:hypothetical protein
MIRPGDERPTKEKVMLNSAKTISHAAFVSLAAVFSATVLAALPAAAHEAPVGWKYPWACCANHDCQQLSDAAISERKDGYVVNQTGEVVAYADKRIKDSPDGLYHWCAHPAGLDAGHTICLFVPPKGF